ncbi:MAG: hypothetical protein WC374_00980 [Phycisphaerae bacterium]|jgi:hypothetical protein
MAMKKELLREPILYYIAVPMLLLLWPLMIWLVYLPNTAKSLERDQRLYTESYELAERILILDPDRRSYGSDKKSSGFDFTVAIDAAARKLGISSANYTISSKPISKSSRQRSRDCQIVINEIEITRLAEFLSNLQMTWANLQCQRVTLTKKEGLPDAWKVDLTLTYYYQ